MQLPSPEGRVVATHRLLAQPSGFDTLERVVAARGFHLAGVEMKLGHIELFVRDPSKSLAFYRDVLECEVGEIQAGGRCIWIKLGSLEVLLREGSPSEQPASYRSGSVGFVIYTENLSERVSQLRLRGLTFRGNDGSATEPTFTDPDGHWFQLVDPTHPG